MTLCCEFNPFAVGVGSAVVGGISNSVIGYRRFDGEASMCVCGFWVLGKPHRSRDLRMGCFERKPLMVDDHEASCVGLPLGRFGAFPPLFKTP